MTINTTIIDIDYNINYKEEKNYILYSNNLHFGLGWDFDQNNTYDLDSSVVTFNRRINYLAKVNFQNLNEYGGVINLNGDDLTGEGDGDDEEIRVTLDLLPPEVKFFTVQINSYRGNSLKHVKSAYIRLSDETEVIGTYSVNQAGDNIGLLIGCFYKNISNTSKVWIFKPLNKVIPGRIVTDSVNTIQGILLDYFGNDTENDMIEKLVDSTKYKDKKGTLSIIGNLLFDYEYEASFVAGVLANIYHEGNIGKFESSAYSPDKKPKYLEYMDTLYDYKNIYSNKLITEVSMYNLSDILEECKANNWEQGKFGLGCVQWTGERTYNLFKLYQQKCDYSDKITIEEATAAEGQMIINELKGNYSSIYKDWKNNNPNKDIDLSAYNAGYNICVKYEVPSDKENKGITRGNTALDMYKIMTS
jgi:tellurium resistance protein TerZ